MSRHILTVVALFSVERSLPAQEAGFPALDTIVLDQVVVTASKVPLPQRETAKPVEIITRADIEGSAARDLSQILDELGGLAINGADSNPGLNKGVYLRGAGTAYTLLLVDGQPVSDPTGVGGAIDLRLFPLDLIERIEVLKGSQSTLYGTDAIAGVINIITRKSGEKALGWRGSLAYGSFSTLDASAGLNGRIGILGYSIDYQRMQSDGISEATDDKGSGDFDKDGFAQNGLQVRTGLHLGQHLEIAPYFRFSDYAGDTDAEAFTDAPNRYQARLINPGLNAQYLRGGLSARLSYGYHATDRNFFTDFGHFPYRGQFHNIDGLLGYRINKHVQLLGGLNRQDHKMLDSTALITDPAVTITSPYLTFLLSDLKGWNLEAGYRFSHHSAFGGQSTFSMASSFQVTANIRAFASFTTGFKAPTLSELYGPFGGNEALEPQTSASWEFGAETDWLEGRFRASAAFFRRRIGNIIVYSFSSGHFNQDRQDDHGLEMEIGWQMLPQLLLSAQYAYVDGEVTTKNSAEQDTSYYNLIRRPRHRLCLSLEYQPLPALSLRLQGKYAGQRIDYFFNPDNFYAIEEVELDPYFLVHFHISYAMAGNRFRIFADLRNITNTSFTEVYGYNTPGFNGYAGLRIRL